MGEKPHRVQLSRAKGWRKPSGTVKVDRSTNFGNPYDRKNTGDVPNADLVFLFRKWIESQDGVNMRRLICEQLPGKNLACWCRVDEPCHADVLLEIANSDSAALKHGGGQ